MHLQFVSLLDICANLDKVNKKYVNIQHSKDLPALLVH